MELIDEILDSNDKILKNNAELIAVNKEWSKLTKKLLDELAKARKDVPSAQPEIIRCKDCKYNYGLTHDGEFNPEDIVCTYFDTDGMQCYDFCSYAERKVTT